MQNIAMRAKIIFTWNKQIPENKYNPHKICMITWNIDTQKQKTKTQN